MKGQIDTWVADADDGSFGFTKDGCHVVVAFADGNAPVTVWFGAEAEGGIYARVDPRPGVLVAPRALRDLARRIYVSRGLLRTDAARIESVRVTSGGKVVPGDPDRLRDAMAGLIAQRVESFEKPAGPPDLVIEVTVSEGGPRRRITCRSSLAGRAPLRARRGERDPGRIRSHACPAARPARRGESPMNIAPRGGAR